MRCRLRTLMVALVLGPPVLAWYSNGFGLSSDTFCNAFMASGWMLIVFGVWCIWPENLTRY